MHTHEAPWGSPSVRASETPPRGIRAARSDFSVSISRALGMVVVTVHGALSPTSSGELRHILWDLIDEQGNRNLVIDLRDMTVGDGADLEVFLDASHCACERGGHLALSGPGAGTSEALARAGLTAALEWR